MTNVFMAGADLVQWELTAFSMEGPYRLTMRHPHGAIVEYFSSTADALRREAELEEMLLAGRGAGPLPARTIR